MQNLRDPENPPFVLSFHENTTATGRQKVWHCLRKFLRFSSIQRGHTFCNPRRRLISSAADELRAFSSPRFMSAFLAATGDRGI